jgi:hypothetical protein
MVVKVITDYSKIDLNILCDLLNERGDCLFIGSILYFKGFFDCKRFLKSCLKKSGGEEAYIQIMTRENSKPEAEYIRQWIVEQCDK